METKCISLTTTLYLPIQPERLRTISDPTQNLRDVFNQGAKARGMGEVFRAHVILLYALLCLLCSSVLVLAQTPSSDYTNDLPSVERVKAEIKGSDPTDTLARQLRGCTERETH